MFWSRSYSSLQALNAGEPKPWGAKVRSAHALADLLKRTHPHLYEPIGELQATITSCHQTLADLQHQQQNTILVSHQEGHLPDENELLRLEQQERSALRELDATMQALLDLRRPKQTTK